MSDEKPQPDILSLRHCPVCKKERQLHRLVNQEPQGGWQKQVWACQTCGCQQICFDTEPAKPLRIQYD